MVFFGLAWAYDHKRLSHLVCCLVLWFPFLFIKINFKVWIIKWSRLFTKFNLRIFALYWILSGIKKNWNFYWQCIIQSRYTFITVLECISLGTKIYKCNVIGNGKRNSNWMRKNNYKQNKCFYASMFIRCTLLFVVYCVLWSKKV